MSTSLPEPLSEVVDRLHARQLPEARSLLVAYLRDHPESDAGWYLLSLALTDPAKQRDSLDRALLANPANTAARERLASLSAPEDAEAVIVAQASPAPAAAQPEKAPDLGAPATGFDWHRTGPGQAEAPAALGDQPASGDWAALRAQSAAPLAERPRDRSKIVWVGLGLVLVVAVCVAGGLYALNAFKYLPTAPVVITALASPAPTLVPTSQPAITPTAQPTPAATLSAVPAATITPTAQSTPSATLVAQVTLAPPEPTLMSNMDAVGKQVRDIRGLVLQGSVTSYLVAPAQVEAALRTLVINPSSLTWVDNQRISLSALGLITPTYDLTRYALNRSTDNLGGFYVPTSTQIYVIGSQFTGVERYIYSHEFDRALTDQNFHVGDPGTQPTCASNAQRCDAMRALVEGDATLLMSLWLRQDGTFQDAADLSTYKPISQTLPEDSPPYISQQLAFPHVQGLAFVSRLYQPGNWSVVDAAYADPPASTAQILHPDKYLQHKTPITVTDASLSKALTAGWRQVDAGVLGEWTTYLILGYGVDPAARLDAATAARATGGWSGDHYQVFYNDATRQTVVAAHWAWDTLQNATDFAAAMRQYQNLRYQGAKFDLKNGSCWANASQSSCTFTTGFETLWLLAPDQTVLANVLSLSPRFH